MKIVLLLIFLLYVLPMVTVLTVLASEYRKGRLEKNLVFNGVIVAITPTLNLVCLLWAVGSRLVDIISHAITGRKR